MILVMTSASAIAVVVLCVLVYGSLSQEH